MVLRGLLVNLSYIGLIILRIHSECLQPRGIWVVRTMCRSPVMIRRGGFTNPSHCQQLLCYQSHARIVCKTHTSWYFPCWPALPSRSSFRVESKSLSHVTVTIRAGTNRDNLQVSTSYCCCRRAIAIFDFVKNLNLLQWNVWRWRVRDLGAGPLAVLTITRCED